MLNGKGKGGNVKRERANMEAPFSRRVSTSSWMTTGFVLDFAKHRQLTAGDSKLDLELYQLPKRTERSVDLAAEGALRLTWIISRDI